MTFLKTVNFTIKKVGVCRNGKLEVQENKRHGKENKKRNITASY